MTVDSSCQISHRKSFSVIYPAFEQQLCIILWWILARKYPKWCVWFTSANHLKREKAVYLQFLTMTVATWCQISHRKSFGVIYAAFEHSYASFYDGFWLKISKMMCLIHIWNRLKRGESCLFAISNHESWLLMPDISAEKNLVQYIQHLTHSYASFYDGFWLKISKMMCLIHVCNRLKRGKAVYLQFLTMTVCLLMSDISQRKFWCNISSIWIQLCLSFMMDFGAK